MESIGGGGRGETTCDELTSHNNISRGVETLWHIPAFEFARALKTI